MNCGDARGLHYGRIPNYSCDYDYIEGSQSLTEL
jgi:hypothetical protein